MVFIDYIKSENFYEFIGEGGERVIIPSVHVVLIDDGSSIVVKNTASRCTVGYLVK